MVYLILALFVCMAAGLVTGYALRTWRLDKAKPSKIAVKRLAAARDDGSIDAERANKAILAAREARKRERMALKAAAKSHKVS